MRWKVEYVEKEAERTVSQQIVARGKDDVHDRKQKPLCSDLDDPCYGLEAVETALVARLVNRVDGRIEAGQLT